MFGSPSALTNDLRSTPAALIIRYARRMPIEDGLADAVNFLHLDALSSAVALIEIAAPREGVLPGA